MKYDFLIIGTGLSGCTCARTLADKGYKILIIEENTHIGGMCHDYIDNNGILVSSYGPHLFHTDSNIVWDFINLYSDWDTYEHIAKVIVDKKFCDFPVNLNTIQQLNIKDVVSDGPDYSNAETYLFSTIGETLTNKIFKNYSYKQWRCELKDLHYSVVERVKIRFDNDPRYFRDRYQVIPRLGYTNFMKTLLDHPNITLELGRKFNKFSDTIEYDRMIYTGPIDRFYDFQYGKLNYIKIFFAQVSFDTKFFQPYAQINYSNPSREYTRTVEYKHINKNLKTVERTSVSFEYPNHLSGLECYPNFNIQSVNLYQKYLELTQQEKNVIFVGRMAEYKYFNMDQAILNAINLTKNL